MASVSRQVDVPLPAERVWAAVRDIGAVQHRLLPGRVVHTRIDGAVRTLTFPDGHTVRELVVDLDDSRRHRLAYAVIDGARPPLQHHHAACR